ncbi:TRAP transporter substrate-binding protein [Pseudooceanicola sp. CBS1P-1]|uniref:DctP family TRAP transporter solute-binding subunit n=1 Tax=Pseudooceanicola albus TaxID=2692189 RepID=A0A6L7G880_9RHOB|nr:MULTISPECIES: TRAP transporter substrate-binding protein [Pseudooceanicola]MBT9384410.1 TRAP transporter substrate-binding protein [Pseudooceanicola endophyticus]MXN19852.1 DctP family TRAP transporter solute-binding subunit [Pseudooceanicola albus]
MTKLSTFGRRAVAALLLSALPVLAQADVVRFAHVDGEGDLLKNPYWTYTEVFSNALETATAGKYEVQVFPNGQLGDLESLAEQNARGSLQMVGGLGAGHLAAYAPVASVLELPYSFPSLAVARKVMNGPFGQKLADQIAEQSGIRILSYLPTAFRNFSSSTKQIKTPEDMKGMKIRTQQVPIHVKMVESLGASPTPIAWSELYSALQTGVVDGQENAPYTMLMANLQEVQKYYTLDHHLVNMVLITINEDYWQSLSDEDKAAFKAANEEATFAMLGVITAKESQDLAQMRKAGVEIYQPTPAEFQQFVDAAQKPVADLLAEKVGEDVIDELKAAVAEAQAQ